MKARDKKITNECSTLERMANVYVCIGYYTNWKRTKDTYLSLVFFACFFGSNGAPQFLFHRMQKRRKTVEATRGFYYDNHEFSSKLLSYLLFHHNKLWLRIFTHRNDKSIGINCIASQMFIELNLAYICRLPRPHIYQTARNVCPHLLFWFFFKFTILLPWPVKWEL